MIILIFVVYISIGSEKGVTEGDKCHIRYIHNYNYYFYYM